MKKYSTSVIALVVAWMLCLAVPQFCSAGARVPEPQKTIVTQAAVQTARVGDIDIGYRVIGDGFPLILITGYSATMDMWDPFVIKELSSRYKVILFDNRGIATTTSSDKPFSIELFAEDAIGLMDALKIRKAHVLGWSMGTFIATEMTLKHPERVDKLILYAGNCDWKGSEVVKADPRVSGALMDLSAPAEERAKRLISILFPGKWLEDHPDFTKGLPRPAAPVSQDSIRRQGQAIGAWAGTCGKLASLTQSTLLITGTEDVIIPPANSLLMASRIPASWLVRMPGGHANMYQYPRTFSRSLLAFLEAEAE